MSPMRRVLRISAAVVVVLLLAGGIIYWANLFSVRTWVLVKALNSGMQSVRDAAAVSLAQRNPEEAVESFIDARANAPGESRYADSCVWFALLPAEIAPRLAAILEDSDPRRAAIAADGLNVLAYKNEEHDFSAVLPALFRTLERKDPKLCLSAASAICSIGEDNADATKALLKASREGCPEVLFHLRSMHLSDEDVGELIESLGHEDRRLRASVASVLGSLAAHRDSVVPRLIAALRDPDDAIVEAALRSLEELEHRDAPTIREITLLLEREHVRIHAVEFLARSTAKSPEALTAVRAGLREPAKATEFLDELGNADPDTVSNDLIPDLLHLCRAGADLDQRMSAVDVLGNMGPRARSAAPALEEILAREESDEFEQSASVALESIKAE